MLMIPYLTRLLYFFFFLKLEMEGHLQNSPKHGYPAYREDENIEKCILGLGTTLVATIEEAKDRISQIEHSAARSFLLSN